MEIIYMFFSLFNSKPVTKKNLKTKKNKTSKMNCSPIVAGKTVSEDTCMTRDILHKIKSEYNHINRDNPIESKDPTEILQQLRERLSCSKEDCWLNQIQDEKLRKKIEKYIFAPKHPHKWKYNPNEWLSNYDIFNVLTQWEDTYPNFEFIGPSFIDFDAKMDTNIGEPKKCVDTDVCNLSLSYQIKHKRDKVAIVFNLDRHDQSGSHWVSLWIDIKDKFIFYFDSAGDKIPDEIMRLVKRLKKQGLKLSKPIHFHFYENYPMEHQYGNTECGMYSLFFIITMLTNKTSDKTFSTWKEKVKFFKQDRVADKYVENLRWKYFNS